MRNKLDLVKYKLMIVLNRKTRAKFKQAYGVNGMNRVSEVNGVNGVSGFYGVLPLLQVFCHSSLL
jgi:hypothetical protein